MIKPWRKCLFSVCPLFSISLFLREVNKVCRVTDWANRMLQHAQTHSKLLQNTEKRERGTFRLIFTLTVSLSFTGLCSRRDSTKWAVSFLFCLMGKMLFFSICFNANSVPLEIITEGCCRTIAKLNTEKREKHLNKINQSKSSMWYCIWSFLILINVLLSL